MNNSTTHNSSSLGPRAEVSKAELLLQDGSRFSGESFGSRCSTAGEVVFNTGMVGYPEAMTDPSYRGQILVLTYPLIGNYGVPANGETKLSENELEIPEFFESNRIQISGLIIATLSKHYSHWSALGFLRFMDAAPKHSGHMQHRHPHVNEEAKEPGNDAGKDRG